MEALVITAERLIPGPADQAPVEHGAVRIEDGRITHVGTVEAAVAPGGHRRLDFPGHTLLPGLIDAHVHLALPGDGSPFPDFVREPGGVHLAVALRNAQAALRAGVTTLKDCGGPGDLTFQLRRAGDLGYAELPRLYLCGRPLTIRGGHCWYFGGECGGRDGVAEMVREVCKQGADYVKAMGSGGGTPGTRSWLPAFTPAELTRMAGAAHQLGRPLAVHCLCAESTLQALAAGADVIEHAGFLTGANAPQRYEPRVGEALAAAGVPVCPTLSVGDTVLPHLQGADRDRWERMHAENHAQVAAMHRAGVRMITGTDAGWRFTPFDAVAREAELLAACGLSAGEAIAAATAGAAQALGLAGETGSLSAGLAADLIAVPGDPLRDLGALRRPALVVRSGRIVRADGQGHAA